MSNSVVLRTLTALTIIVALGFGGSVAAESFFKQVTHSGALEMMGQSIPEKHDTTVLWVTEGKACAQTGTDSYVIYDAEAATIYAVDRGAQQYSVLPLDHKAGVDSGDPEAVKQAQMMQAAQAMMGTPKVTVTKTEQTRKIGDWETTLYDVTMSLAMMTTRQEMWVTQDIDVDYDMLQAVYGGLMAIMPGFGEMFEQLKKIDGVPVTTTVTASMMGQEMVTTTEIIEYAEKAAPAGTFEIPDNYKKVAVDLGMGGM